MNYKYSKFIYEYSKSTMDIRNSFINIQNQLWLFKKSFLSTFTCHIGHHRPLNSNNKCSLGSGIGGQIINLHKNRRHNI